MVPYESGVKVLILQVCNDSEFQMKSHFLDKLKGVKQIQKIYFNRSLKVQALHDQLFLGNKFCASTEDL